MVQNDRTSPRILLSGVKRNLLVGRICLFSTILAILHFVLDLSQGLYESAAVDFLFALVIVIAWLLNSRGYHRASKVFLLAVLNVLFMFFGSVLPKEVGIYLYYFPLIVGSSTLFESNEKRLRYLFTGMPLVLLSFLTFFEFDLLRNIQFQSPIDTNIFFAVNAFSSAAITILCVSFMQTLNIYSERELKGLADEINGKNIHLEKTNAELDRFLYSTSHDLRSPLSSIKGLINIARMETNDQKIQQYFGMMVDRVDKLDFFINDIIDYSKNARTDVQAEPVDFNALLMEISENLKYTEGAESIRLNISVAVDHVIKVDRSRLTIVLNNLLANAIKYHDRRKEDQWIDVAVSNSNGAVKIGIADNGTGIDPEHHSRVFDMFYRGTFQSKGSGLGLYIVKEAVTKMQGTIVLESEPGKGSSFVITLPVV